MLDQEYVPQTVWMLISYFHNGFCSSQKRLFYLLGIPLFVNIN